MAPPTKSITTSTCRLITHRYQQVTARTPSHIHTHNQPRHFTHSSRCPVNPLQNLSHFSAAKEAQFLSKERRIPREEFHPYIQLIRSSEVDPFAPVPGTSPSVMAALREAQLGKVDKDTTYTLAMSNMMARMELYRWETKRLGDELGVLQGKHKRDQRDALVLIFITGGLLAVVMLKTSAVEDLKGYVFGGAAAAAAGSKDVAEVERRKWTGDSASQMFETWQTRFDPSEGRSRESHGVSRTPLVRAQQTDGKRLVSGSSEVRSPPQSPSPSYAPAWTLSQLFWKPRDGK